MKKACKLYTMLKSRVQPDNWALSPSPGWPPGVYHRPKWLPPRPPWFARAGAGGQPFLRFGPFFSGMLAQNRRQWGRRLVSGRCGSAGSALALLPAGGNRGGAVGGARPLVRAHRGLQRDNWGRSRDNSRISRRDSVAAGADFRNRRRPCRRRLPEGGQRGPNGRQNISRHPP